MRSPIADLLADLRAALDSARIPWFLFGAQAALLHGASRLTADVDITVRLPEGMPTATLVHTLEQRHFRGSIADPGFVERTRVVPFVHTPTALPLDVVLAGPGLEERFFERAQSRDLEGLLIPVASPEDIIVMKVLAGRQKDEDDVVAILKAHRQDLDRDYVVATVRALEQALSQSDLLPAFQRAVKRAGVTDPR